MTLLVRLKDWCFPPKKPLLVGLERFLGQEIVVLPSGDSRGRNVSVEFRGPEGRVLYDKTYPRNQCVIEGVEIIPSTGMYCSLIFVNGELSVLRYDGSKPNYSGELPVRESEALHGFMKTLRERLTAHTQLKNTK